MLAATEINLVNGFIAIALGFCLLGLVAWVDRKYLQRYEEVQADREEAEGRKVEKLEAVPTDEVTVVEADATGPVAVSSGDLQWKDAEPESSVRKVQPAPEAEPAPVVQAEPVVEPEAEPVVEPAPVVAAAVVAAATVEPATRPEPARALEPEVEPEPAAAPAASAPAMAAQLTAPADVKITMSAPQPEPAAVAEPDPEPAPAIDLRTEVEPAREAERVPAAVPAATAAEPPLPKGAAAALDSILAVIPDPRNTVALTRDPTAEVHVTRSERDQAREAATRPRPAYEPPAPSDEEWETPSEAAARDRRVATPDPVTPR